MKVKPYQNDLTEHEQNDLFEEFADICWETYSLIRRHLEYE